MAENQSPTPERELLKLIEEKKAGSSFAGKGSLRKGLSLFSLGGLRGRFSFFKVSLFKVFSGQVSLDITDINKLLIIAALGIFSFMSFDLATSMLGIKEQVDSAFKIDRDIKGFNVKDIAFLKNPSFYLEKARKRDIFKMTSKEIKDEAKKEGEEAAKQDPVKEVAKMTANLKLVGISWSDDPDAMIEDTKAQKTFFLKRGDFIGEVEVAGIFKDKVILRYQGQEKELK
ncbi:MAG: hypothetical protein JW734_01475 [Candidatus Omnitrophica bacterium]|nr:hypothetical protein [Candidatus Omnitrophota bacterium]